MHDKFPPEIICSDALKLN